MFIRRAKTRATESGETYYAYRLVRSERSADMDLVPGSVRKMVVCRHGRVTENRDVVPHTENIACNLLRNNTL